MVRVVEEVQVASEDALDQQRVVAVDGPPEAKGRVNPWAEVSRGL